MLIGDAIHNFIDGLVIAVTFLLNVNLGIVTTLMIMLYETPQELGLFDSLVYAGFTRRALVLSFVAQTTCILGGIIGSLSPFLTAFAAGEFVYIAASDLVPEVHKAYKGDVKKSIALLFSLIFGIVCMLSIHLFFG